MEKINPNFLRLKDMLQAIDDATSAHTRGLDDRHLLMAASYAIAIIGEGAGKLSTDFTAQHSAIPWRQIIGMRHRIIHDYGNVSRARLEEAIIRDLPILKQEIEEILASDF